jgi:23S rRNA pseudouridine1911/1915/1917 synthase
MSKNLEILYEDNHLIALNKPSGMLVQGDKTGDEPLSEKVKQFIKVKDKKAGDVYLGVPHRIDRPTSGIVLFAKTSKALIRLNKMFQEKEIEKTYWAVVKNKPSREQDVLVHYLTRNPQKNKSFASTKESANSKKSELAYEVIYELSNYYLLAVYPKTGRHHQIRSQLSFIGCPIKGDLKYGFDRSNEDAGISLHARSIRFVHPVKGEEIYIEALPPKSEKVWKAIRRLYLNK